MKRLSLVLLLILSLTLSLFTYAPRIKANATTNQVVYGTGKNETTYLFSRPNDLSALFILPFSYCVEILGEHDDYYYVKYADDVGEYKAVYGYCLKDEITLLEQAPEKVFLQMNISVTFKQDTGNSSLPVLNEITVSAAFYGSFISGGAEYSYVLYNGQFGYVLGKTDYPLNDLTANDDVPTTTEQNDMMGKIITAVCLATLSTVAFILLVSVGKKSKGRTTASTESFRLADRP